MDNIERNFDSWVDDRLAALEPARGWRPNADRAWSQLQAREGARRNRRWPAFWTAVAAAVFLVTIGLVWRSAPRREPKPTIAPPAQAVVVPAPAPMPSAPAPAAKPKPPKPAVTARAGEGPERKRNFRESGDPGAPIALEVYLDYQCPHCGPFCRTVLAPLIAEYVETGKARLLRRDLPMRPHPYAELAARYADAAGLAGAYDTAVERIFETAPDWSRDGNIDAQLAGVLPGEVMRQVREWVNRDPRIDALLAEDADAARRDQINFVPAVVLVAKGERRSLGHIATYAELKAQVDLALAAQKGRRPAPVAE